jgi:DNA-binding winged helix-turn-helix (wHTH) protein/tetratricopeptide (TPR) repeat protein
MRYRFGDYNLDSAAQLLSHHGQIVAVPRRVFNCLSLLIEQRQRVISRDELIRKIWGRDNVSDHQLAQTVRATRQLLGDDGNTQSMIRTVLGVGYHWVAQVLENPALSVPAEITAPLPHLLQPVADAVIEAASLRQTPMAAMAPISAPAMPARATFAPTLRAVVRRSVFALASLAALTAACIEWQAPGIAAVAAISVPSTVKAPAPSDPLTRLETLLAQGKFEDVRAGLAQLPENLVNSANARMLEIDLDLERGRWPRATEKLHIQQQRALTAADPIWQAKLLMQQSKLLYLTGAPGVAILAPAQAALERVESLQVAVAPALFAKLVKQRGSAYLAANQLDLAALDFVQARDYYLGVGDQRLGARASCSLARVWLRQGRLIEALAQVQANAVTYARLQDAVSELLARNTALRIEVELLRWTDALASSDRSMQLLQLVPDTERGLRTLQLRAMVLTGLGRLREAESILEEAQARQPAGNLAGSDQMVPALLQLASAHYSEALVSAAHSFANTPADPYNILLEGRDGALLLWVMAVQGFAAKGLALPSPSAAQQQALLKPESTLARIAQGRWLLVHGEMQPAQAALRQALTEARQQHYLYRMLLAGEPLMALLTQIGDVKAARDVLVQLRAEDPKRIDRARRMQLELQRAQVYAQVDND